jgi:hypothetical protein
MKRKRICTLVCLVFSLVTLESVESRCVSAGIIRLDNLPGSLGERLDGLSASGLGVPILVPGFEPLTITVTDIGLDALAPTLNSTANGLGINSLGSDAPDRFDALFDEQLEIAFSQKVRFLQLDFRHFSAGEAFEFAGITVSNDDLSDGRTDVFDFSSPLIVDAHTPIMLAASIGSIGLEALTLEVLVSGPAQPNSTVPEPSTMVMLATFGLGCLPIRRHRTSSCAKNGNGRRVDRQSVRFGHCDQQNEISRFSTAL